MPPRNLQKASQSRVFTFAGPAGPGVPPVYQGLARAHGVNWPLGASTPIRVPSDKRYGDFTDHRPHPGPEGPAHDAA
jgi:hypothetical protein